MLWNKLTLNIEIRSKIKTYTLIFHEKNIMNYHWKSPTSLRLTHWCWVTHICVSNLNITGSDNGLSPGRRQAIIWTNAGILFIGPLGTNFSEILTEILTFSFKENAFETVVCEMAAIFLCLNVLKTPLKSLHWLLTVIELSAARDITVSQKS